MDNTVQQQLTKLLQLQTIDCGLDEITRMRGALPKEVQELEDVLDNLRKRAGYIENELTTLEQHINTRRVHIKDTGELIKKYEAQQTSVRNNREYNAITKEIDLQALEVQLAEKSIKDAYAKIDENKILLDQSQGLIEKQKQVLSEKQGKLQLLIEVSEEEEQKLQIERQQLSKHIEDRLLKLYERIRARAQNHLAVVTVKRESCGGCFSKVPPQKQADIQEQQHIIMCEHCGRVLADVVPLVDPNAC